VALATCAEVPELDEDGPALLEALRQRGIAGIPAVWDEPGIDWDAFELVVPRSTWDYAERRNEFLDWASGLPRVLNSLPVLRWSSDKRYLTELEQAGVPIVPTLLLEPGAAFDPPGREFVVKPVVSAGGRSSARYLPEDARAAAAHVQALHAEERDVLVQPHVAGVDEAGEIALVYLGGHFSHAVRKHVALGRGALGEGELYLEERIAPAQSSKADLDVAGAVLAALPFEPAELLYGRIDLVHDPGPLVLEVELVEPSLYLLHGQGAADRLAGLIDDAARAAS
jgi:glutathione synthase/RimK-type ligase-like ATP-grasp enzyme